MAFTPVEFEMGRSCVTLNHNKAKYKRHNSAKRGDRISAHLSPVAVLDAVNAVVRVVDDFEAADEAVVVQPGVDRERVVTLAGREKVPTVRVGCTEDPNHYVLASFVCRIL